MGVCVCVCECREANMCECVCIAITTLKQQIWWMTNRHTSKWEMSMLNSGGYVPHVHLYSLLSPSRDYDWPPHMRLNSVDDAPAVTWPHGCPVDSIARCRLILNLDRWTHDPPCSVRNRKKKNAIPYWFSWIAAICFGQTYSDFLEDISRFGQKFLHDILVDGRYLH